MCNRIVLTSPLKSCLPILNLIIREKDCLTNLSLTQSLLAFFLKNKTKQNPNLCYILFNCPKFFNISKYYDLLLKSKWVSNAAWHTEMHFSEPSCFLEEKKADIVTFLSGSYRDSFSFKGQMPVSTLVSGQYVFLLKAERARGYLKWVAAFDSQQWCEYAMIEKQRLRKLNWFFSFKTCCWDSIWPLSFHTLQPQSG